MRYSLTPSLVDVFEQFERLQIGRARSLPTVDRVTLRLAFERYFAELEPLPMWPEPLDRSRLITRNGR